MNELENIKKITTKLTAAAKNAGRKPPEIIVSVLLIPGWANNSSYASENYKIAKNKLLNYLEEKIEDDKDLVNVHVENFYGKKTLTESEKGYLNKLEARGSNADMIKTHAIICPENQNRRHLQLDSNTKIYDYTALYNQTFGAQDQRDALNASFYDEHYVSAHNKIVYTTPKGKIAPALRDVHLQYCEEHKDDHTIIGREAEKKTKNSIYSKDFTIAFKNAGLTNEQIITPNENTQKIIYPAVMNQPEYRLTKNVITAVNMSWRKSENFDEFEQRKNLPAIPVGDTECDYVSFLNAVKKYTADLTDHGESLYDDNEAHNELMAISDQVREKGMIKDFILNVSEKYPDMLETVVWTIPDNPRGSDMTQELFKKSVYELSQSKKLQIEVLDNQDNDSTPKLR